MDASSMIMTAPAASLEACFPVAKPASPSRGEPVETAHGELVEP
jgi:hypothetical protein